MARSYQICSHCILDTVDDESLQFDNKGVCNYCNQFTNSQSESGIVQPDYKEKKLKSFFVFDK